MTTEDSSSEIVKFYNNRSIFITGGTGFLGKVLIEKFLRSCPGINYIYILVRPKGNKTIQDRLEDLLNSAVFETLRNSDSNVLEKLVPIPGDITSPNLGISKEDERTLHENVSVVIHSAATVKFDEVMSLSADINVGGVQRVIELAKNMKKISAIIHISTAYSNCDRQEINEVVYPVSFDPAIAIKTFAWLGDKVLKKITPELIGRKPNTYAYTKSLAEQLVQSNRGDLPVCIVRPSVVTATVKEPVEGWIDNLQGASAVLIAHGKGLLGATVADDDIILDWIPVDYLVNLIITAAWDLGTKRHTDLLVYNCCSGQLNPLYQHMIRKYSEEAYYRTPFNEVFGYPSMNTTMKPTWSKLHNWITVLFPSILIDLVAISMGRKARMLKYYTKVQTSVRFTKFFRTNDWRFTTANLVALRSKMNATDKSKFNFNVEDIDWRTYMHKYIHGLRKYVLKEDDSTLLLARQRLRRFSQICSWIRILSFLLIIGMSSGMMKPWLIRILAKCMQRLS